MLVIAKSIVENRRGCFITLDWKYMLKRVNALLQAKSWYIEYWENIYCIICHYYE